MMKKKRYALLLAGLILLSLAGCGSREPLPDITDNPSSASASSDITSADESNGDIPASPSVPAESESPAESVSETRQQTEVTKSPAKPTRYGGCCRTKTVCTGRRKNKSCLICTAARKNRNRKNRLPRLHSRQRRNRPKASRRRRAHRPKNPLFPILISKPGSTMPKPML